MRKSPWELLIEGDREAFISIYETNYQHLFTYGFSLCGDKELTKDCIQEQQAKIIEQDKLNAAQDKSITELKEIIKALQKEIETMKKQGCAKQ